MAMRSSLALKLVGKGAVNDPEGKDPHRMPFYSYYHEIGHIDNVLRGGRTSVAPLRL